MVPHKIFNDPVYGFVTVNKGILMDVLNHPWVQRLRRIRQLGMTDYVYPGALHTRFQHAMGAMHLMQSAVTVLRSKGIPITHEESEAAQAAILMHDIGHGPFSHVMEHVLLPFHHEELSAALMKALNHQFDGRLSMALDIFNGHYEKPFLHQLVSGQLDMDRLDYLNRDSFFTGVHEGVIGYDRIITMLHVHDGHLVVEEKGIYSIEKFLIARRLMYWQVYLHKTVLSAEKMLICFFERLRHLYRNGQIQPRSDLIRKMMDFTQEGKHSPDEMLEDFTRLDDHDVIQEIKYHRQAPDYLLGFLANSLLDRRLFQVTLSRDQPSESMMADVRARLQDAYAHLTQDWQGLLLTGVEVASAYKEHEGEILILRKNGTIVPFSEETDAPIQERTTGKYYVIHPKLG